MVITCNTVGFSRYRLPTSVTQFRVDEVSGLIYKIPGVVFDRESMDSLYIPVIAYDGPASPSRSSIVPVYVSIKVSYMIRQTGIVYIFVFHSYM